MSNGHLHLWICLRLLHVEKSVTDVMIAHQARLHRLRCLTYSEVEQVQFVMFATVIELIPLVGRKGNEAIKYSSSWLSKADIMALKQLFSWNDGIQG